MVSPATRDRRNTILPSHCVSCLGIIFWMVRTILYSSTSPNSAINCRRAVHVLCPGSLNPHLGRSYLLIVAPFKVSPTRRIVSSLVRSALETRKGGGYTRFPCFQISQAGSCPKR